ncbi:MAG: hypothetical protein ISS71_09730 [Phycisphaerae bacterium]|nr:hypothetical protein [Phycisphaerae bacterium]
MNLKAACKTAISVILLSILLIMVGYVLVYIPMVMRHFHWGVIENAIVEILKYLLEPAGFLVFLLAFTARLRHQSTNLKILFVFAGIHVLLGTLISTTSSLRYTGALPEYFGSLGTVFYMTIYGLILISGLCLSTFIFFQADRTLAVKPLARTILIANLFICGFIIINSIVYRPWNKPSIIYMIGSIAMTFGYLAKLSALLIFLLAWLKQNPSPPQAAAPAPNPEPLLVLSDERDIPEE